MAAVMMCTTGCLAQKKAVNSAKNKAMSAEAPDFEGARADIKAALEDDETKGQANTWYVAGLIGYKQNEYAMLREQMGQAKDVAKVGEGVVESVKYWLKADEIAMTPTLDKKGREVVDTKTRKMIAEKLSEYYRMQDLVKYGIYLNDNRDYSKAYEVFMMHLQIPELEMMQTEKYQKEMPRDTTYLQYKYYAAIFATQSERHEEAIALYEQMKDGDFEAITVNQFLYQEYVALKDTASYVRVLQEASAKFPQEPWFLQNLINHYIYSGQQEQAVDYLKQAIEREPNMVQYYTILGRLYNDAKNFDEAKKYFETAKNIDPSNAEAWAGVGYMYMDKATQMMDNINPKATAKEYDAALKEVNKTYKEALPYFEKAHELDKENTYYLRNLKSLYFRFRDEKGMTEKYEAVTAEMNNL